MLWIIAILTVIACYFAFLSGKAWQKWRGQLTGEKRVLILVFKNAQQLVEAVMWDLFRLKSWNYHDLNFMVMDNDSSDDTFFILKALQRNHPFILINPSLGKRFEGIFKLQGKKVLILHVNGGESPKTVRKKMVYLLNQHRQEGELPLRKFS